MRLWASFGVSILGGPGNSNGIGILPLLLASRAVAMLRLNSYREETSMSAQLNRFMALFALCGLLTRPAIAASADSLSTQTKAMDTSLDYWTGRIEQDTTWRDTVYVSGDVTIATGVTLTLAPDTQVHFLPYRDDAQGGLDSTRAELIVEGRLHAQAESIVFRSAAATSLGADWYGIVVERGGLADVSNAAIRDGLRCLYAKMGGRVTMDHVAFANCGKPSAQSFSRRSAASDSLSEQMGRFLVQAGRVDEMDTDKRVAKKLSYGALGGVGGGSVRAVMGFALGFGACSDCDRDGHDGCDLCGLGPIVGSVIVGSIGYSIGTAVGVSRVDPHDLFGASLIVSVVGLAGGIGLVSASESELLFPSILIGPVVGATLASEWSRSLNPSDKKLPFFMNLVPDSRGRLAAVATLRF